ncbi:FAD/NAD(P)-binding domain-containing protein [Stipitochalara longipes BDJ]|nr:FAD/NAD(P)-binding domain-containing protein [Stipitochalara longipes BDJ]
MPKSCLIIGGGIAGLSVALALDKAGIKSTIYELRTSPSTIGGSINLTPNALRLLEFLDVEVKGCRVDSIEIFSLHTGKLLGELPFRKFGPSLRILREELLRTLLRAVEKKGIEVVYGSKLTGIEDDELDAKVTAVFENGKSVQGDFILGCDGVHSAVRRYVEPSRGPEYTGVVVAYSVIDGTGFKTHFRSTALNSGRFGSLLTSYVDEDRARIYVGAVMEMKEENDKQGWRVRGSDKQKTREEIERRYKDTGIPCVNGLVKKVDDFVFYPVYKLGPGGVWSRGRALLLGDAAHGMPPQGESTGLAIEDGVLLARVMASTSEKLTQESFQAYEKTRRPRIDTAYKEAVMRWENVKDRSWFFQKVIEWLMWLVLWYKWTPFESSMSYDVRKEEILE